MFVSWCVLQLAGIERPPDQFSTACFVQMQQPPVAQPAGTEQPPPVVQPAGTERPPDQF